MLYYLISLFSIYLFHQIFKTQTIMAKSFEMYKNTTGGFDLSL